MFKKEEIKACPFCGGKAALKASRKFANAFVLYVQCNKCDAQGGGVCASFDKEYETVDNVLSASEEAVHNWNKRTNEG